MRRENTIRIDFSNLPKKPSYDKMYEFCRTVLGLKREDVKRIQCHRGESCVFVKVADLALAQKVVDEHDGRHEVECDGKKYRLRITMEDGSVEVRIWDLPEDVLEETIVGFLRQYGEVLSIRELMYSEGHEYEGVSLGIWSARMVVQRNIDSWATIDGVRAYFAYKGQLQSCRHCHEQAHSGISCVQNKKLLVQKSYANVAKQPGPQQQRSQRKPSAVKPPVPKPPKSKPAGPKPAMPPPVTSENFPELPPPVEENTVSGSETSTTVQPMVVVSPCVLSQRTANPPTTRSRALADGTTTSMAPVELFKKPSGVLTRSTSNGNETDESSTSTSSRRSRGRQLIKKPRRDDEDDGMEEC